MTSPRRALLLIDRYEPGVYSTLHVLDEVWWDWVRQPAPPALGQRSPVEVVLPEGRRTEDGLTSCRASRGSFWNDLMHAAVSALERADAEVSLPGLDQWVDEDAVREAAYAACAARGIDRSDVLEGLWY